MTTLSSVEPVTGGVGGEVEVRPLRTADLPEADTILRLAFGTFLGLPDPKQFMGDAAYVAPRFRASPDSAFAAVLDGRLAGSNFATNWGSVGFFGPLSIHPEFWDRGIGKRLMEPVLDCFERWSVRHAGLLTFPESRKHVGLYQKFGFRPRFLTVVASKPATPPRGIVRYTRFSDLPAAERREMIAACRRLTDSLYEGLDLESEIRAVADQKAGETLLLMDGDELGGFAVCHHGPGTEGGSNWALVKFGAVASGPAAEHRFDRLLDAAEVWALERGAPRVAAGVNTAREEAYGRLLAHGYRADIIGVAMHRPNEPGYSRPGVFVLDDWR